MNRPQVSVIISTYNRAHLLPRAIQSVLSQTFQDFELIVVDDGSTDTTREVVEEFMAHDERIFYLWEKNSGGAARPKNAGIQKSQGECIAILDSDDAWMTQKLEKQIAKLEESKNKKVGAVGCDIIVVDLAYGGDFIYRVPHYRDVLKSMLESDTMGTGSAMVYKKDIFDQLGGFDEGLRSGQDREMRIRIAERYDFDFVREPLVRYYVEHDNISTALDIEKREKDWEYLFEKYRKYYQNDPRLWSRKLRYDGTRYILLGDAKKARREFLESLGKNPFNGKSILYLLVSFMGPRFYLRLTRLKLRIRQIVRLAQ